MTTTCSSCGRTARRLELHHGRVAIVCTHCPRVTVLVASSSSTDHPTSSADRLEREDQPA